jgi:hypothetical protein
LASVYEWRWPQSEFDPRFDLVVAIFVQFADPAMRRFMFERMIGALRPGGLVLVEGYTPAQLKYATGGPKQVNQLYTEDSLREAFGALEILELRPEANVFDRRISPPSGPGARLAPSQGRLAAAP